MKLSQANRGRKGREGNTAARVARQHSTAAQQHNTTTQQCSDRQQEQPSGPPQEPRSLVPAQQEQQEQLHQRSQRPRLQLSITFNSSSNSHHLALLDYSLLLLECASLKSLRCPKWQSPSLRVLSLLSTKKLVISLTKMNSWQPLRLIRSMWK